MVALCDVYVHDGPASSFSSRTQSCESEYLSAGNRLLSAACIPQPKLIVHYKAVNSSREQVFTLDISSARCWLRHNHLWANEMWMHWSELQSLMYLTFLSHETTSFFTRDVSGWKNNQWNQEKLNSLISVGSTFVTLMVIFRLTPELFKKANILFLFTFVLKCYVIFFLVVSWGVLLAVLSFIIVTQCLCGLVCWGTKSSIILWSYSI